MSSKPWYGVCARCNGGITDQDCVGEACRVEKLQEKIDRELLEQIIRALKMNEDLRKEFQKVLKIPMY